MVNREDNSKKSLVEELFRRYYKILRAYAVRLLGDRDMAEDMVQDVYYELWKRQDQLVMEEAIKSYLFRAIYTKCLNYLNSRSYTDQEPFEQTTEGRIQHIYLQAQMSDQESELIYRELRDKIHAIFETLPEQCRKVFLLSRQQELKNREIAEQLGISIKTVEKHISKALSVMRTHLDDMGLILLLPLFF